MWYNLVKKVGEHFGEKEGKGDYMNRICDLHTHSVFSDGTYTPSEIIDEAIEIGLSAVALCDHNTVDGLPEFLSAARNKNIDPIPASEFSVDYNGVELHLLGLFISPAYFSQVSEKMREMIIRKEISNIELVESLKKCGIFLNYDEIKASTPNGKINRAHLAAVMTSKGYTESIPQAFDRYLSVSAGHYREPERFTVWEIIDFILSIHALPILAHPFLNLSADRLAELLPLAKRNGLVGMECFYPLYDDRTTQTALLMAKDFALKFSGGSDFHGLNKPGIKLGIGKGNLQIPYEWYLSLKEDLK